MESGHFFILQNEQIKIKFNRIFIILVKTLDFWFVFVYNFARIFKEVSNTPESGRREGIE